MSSGGLHEIMNLWVMTFLVCLVKSSFLQTPLTLCFKIQEGNFKSFEHIFKNNVCSRAGRCLPKLAYDDVHDECTATGY